MVEEPIRVKENLVAQPVGIGSEAFFSLMHLESDAVVQASCLSTIKPLLRCYEPTSVWECHLASSQFSRVNCQKALLLENSLAFQL